MDILFVTKSILSCFLLLLGFFVFFFFLGGGRGMMYLIYYDYFEIVLSDRNRIFFF